MSLQPLKDWIMKFSTRAYLYGVVVAMVSLLVFYGVIVKEAAALWCALALAALAVPTPVHTLAAKVSRTPPPDGVHTGTDPEEGDTDAV